MNRQSRYKLLKLFIVILITLNNSFAQINQEEAFEPGISKPIGIETILNRLINSKDSLIVYNNEVINLGNYSIQKIDRVFKNAKIDSGILQLNKSIEFHNCTITGKGLSNLKLNRVIFNGCEIASMSIANLKAKQLEFYHGPLRSLRILNSTIDNLILYNLENPDVESGSISIFKSSIRNKLLISRNSYYDNIGVFSSDLANLRFQKNNSRAVGIINNQITNELLVLEEKTSELSVRKNSFYSSDTLKYTFEIDCDKLIFLDNKVHVPILFADSKITTRVDMADNIFTRPIDVHEVSFPEFGKYIPFSQFHEGFVVYDNLYGEESPDGANCYYCELYTGENDEELADKTNFDKLVQSYEILFHGYKSTGDIESANLSYIQIKDLYLNRLGYIYRTDGGFKNYFRWKLAQLLKFYTNHGTDPALSILISIYVVLIFAVFYIFFPSEWDVTSKTRLIADFKDFIDKNEKGRFKPFLALLAGLIISLLNAITLSLNSFVTLGFGTIPTTGAARYVCILQGFIGWFLLSIFTVSLINQILF